MTTDEIYRCLLKRILKGCFVTNNIHYFTKAELIEFCKNRGIKKHSKLNKKELVIKINNYRKHELFIFLKKTISCPDDIIREIVSFVSFDDTDDECRCKEIMLCQQIYAECENEKKLNYLINRSFYKKNSNRILLIKWFKKLKKNDYYFQNNIDKLSTKQLYFLYTWQWEKINILAMQPSIIISLEGSEDLTKWLKYLHYPYFGKSKKRLVGLVLEKCTLLNSMYPNLYNTYD